MYVPAPNVITDEAEIRRFVAAVGSAHLVSVDADGAPLATLLPIVWRDDVAIAHFARANPHWRSIGTDAAVLLVVSGPEAYVSPSWYASKLEHGRVVPTWNYSSVQLRGRARVHEDVTWLRSAVDELVEVHERYRADPWSTADAPERFVAGQLRGIVGVEVRVEQVEGKAKLSQNKSADDRRGVVEGLAAEPSVGAREVARQMQEQTGSRP